MRRLLPDPSRAEAVYAALACRHPELAFDGKELALLLYAGFSFRRLLDAHRLHHATPADHGDPDWHDGEHTHPVRWYLTFLSRYLRWPQLVFMAVAFNFIMIASRADAASAFSSIFAAAVFLSAKKDM